MVSPDSRANCCWQWTIFWTISGGTGSETKARTESFILLIIAILAVSAKISVVLVCMAISLRADPPPGYYQGATNKTAFALRAALHEIINDHNVIPYSSSSFDTADALRILAQDLQNPAN